MMRIFLGLFCLIALLSTPANGQQIAVDNFARLKHRPFTKRTFTRNKKEALLDLYTHEKGFSFQGAGGLALSAEEGEDCVILSLPHKTSYVIINHPLYGKVNWKIPMKPLKKRKHYRGDLITQSLEKEFKPMSQWVLFHIQPRHAMVTIDSVCYKTMNGTLQLFLPLGRHLCTIESPFFASHQDSIILDADSRVVKTVTLTPQYSYLKVNMEGVDAEVRLDGEVVGKTNRTSKRIMPGHYLLTVVTDRGYYYRDSVCIESAEKRILDLTAEWGTSSQLIGESVFVAEDTPFASDKQEVVAPVHIKAFDTNTQIWLNRELLGYGSWEGCLNKGFYVIHSQKDTLLSRAYYLWVEDNRPKEVNLASPKADYGVLNISSNETDATVYLNNVAMGNAPCMIQDLPINRSYTIELRKNGLRSVTKEVLLKGNDMVSLQLNFKKKSKSKNMNI